MNGSQNHPFQSLFPIWSPFKKKCIYMTPIMPPIPPYLRQASISWYKMVPTGCWLQPGLDPRSGGVLCVGWTRWTPGASRVRSRAPDTLLPVAPAPSKILKKEEGGLNNTRTQYVCILLTPLKWISLNNQVFPSSLLNLNNVLDVVLVVYLPRFFCICVCVWMVAPIIPAHIHAFPRSSYAPKF